MLTSDPGSGIRDIGGRARQFCRALSYNVGKRVRGNDTKNDMVFLTGLDGGCAGNNIPAEKKKAHFFNDSLILYFTKYTVKRK